MEEIYKNIFEIKIPLPETPLKTLSSYLIKGKRNLLIDTGLNLDLCLQTMKSALEELKVELDTTDIFLTHVHSDHAGLVGDLLNDNNRLYMSYNDGRFLNELIFIDYMKKVEIEAKLMGIPLERTMTKGKAGAESLINTKYVDFIRMEEGDRLQVGEYDFKVIDLKGHTPGQLGLYEPNHGLFFCGDHIMNEISPNIVCWNDCADSIQLFTDNLKKVKELDLKYVFPGHRGRVVNWKDRVDELLRHHERRCIEVEKAIESGCHSVYEIASTITWDYKHGDFASFPRSQVWFSTSETFAHLEHLRKQGVLKRSIIDGRYRYETA